MMVMSILLRIKVRKRKKMNFTVSHSVSGGNVWLYGVTAVFGSTVRCVAVVFVAAYRISAPTNKPEIKYKLILNPSFI